jgi:hypothetical protein
MLSVCSNFTSVRVFFGFFAEVGIEVSLYFCYN